MACLMNDEIARTQNFAGVEKGYKCKARAAPAQ